MRRDVDRTEIPSGSAYNLLDFIPDEIQAVTGGRGGWTYAGSSLSAATQIKAMGFYTSPSGPSSNRLLAIDQAKVLWDVIAASNLGTAANLPTGPGFFHRTVTVWPTAAAPITCGGGAPGTIAGAPTDSVFGLVYKDHSVLACPAVPGGLHVRLYFSAAGDPTTWDTTYGYWDTSGTIIGLAALPNNILIFHPDSTERLRGAVPPPGSDMVLEPFLPNVGCIDGFSIAYWQQNAIFASPQGIYMTNGTSSVDLTDAAQLKTYWQSLMSSYATTWRIAGGVYRDHYIVSINNGNTLIDCLCFSLTNRTAWRFTNLHGSSFVNTQQSQQEKLYMGLWSAGRVAELSTLWSPASAVKQDADGTTPTPIVETGMFRGYDRLHRRWIESMGKQKWRWCYVDYDIRDAASDNPTGTLSYCTDPAGSYTQAGLTIAESTKTTRVRRALSPTQGGATHSQMLGLKFAVTGPYASANLYTLEGAFEPIETGAL